LRESKQLFMYFDKTKKELIKLRKLPILPVLSYVVVIIVFGSLLKEISNLGNLAYIITTFILPFLSSTADWLTGGNLARAFYKDWIALPIIVHLLIIIDCLIIYNLIKIIISKELWIKKILNK